MSKFDTSKEKLRTIFDLVQNNQFLLDKKDLSDSFINQQHLNVPIFELYESDWQTVLIGEEIPGIYRTDTSRTNTTPLIKKIYYEHEIPSIEIPEQFLPFVEFLTEVKTIPGYDTFGAVVQTRESYRIKHEVNVGGNIIFKGVASSRKRRYTQEDITNGVVDENSLKRLWVMDFGSEVGYIKSIQIIYDIVPNTSFCSSSPNKKIYSIDYDTSKERITSLSSSSVTGIATVKQYTYTSGIFPDTSCTETITTLVDKSSTTQSFSGAFQITIKGERIPPTIDIIDFPDLTVNTAPVDPIDTETYWLYFGSDRVPPRVGFTQVDGDDRLVELPNATAFPSYNVGTIVVTPYAELEKEDFYENTNKAIGQIKISKSTETIERWRIWIDGSFLISGIPIKEDDLVNVLSNNEKINTYTSPYTSISNTDIIINKVRYRMIDQEVKWRIRAVIKNPFYERSIAKSRKHG